MKILKFIAYLMLFCIFCAVITTPPYNIIFIGFCILAAYWIFKNKKVEIKREDTSIKPVPTQQQHRKKPAPKEYNYGKKASKLPKNYCVLDLETTGLSPRNNEIIEIGILKIKNNKIVPTKALQLEISKIKGLSKNAKKRMLANPVTHDFIATLMLFDRVCASKTMKRNIYNDLHDLFENRFLRHQDYFKQDLLLVSSYNFILKIIDFLDSGVYNLSEEQKS